jgi:hypothetical protein
MIGIEKMPFRLPLLIAANWFWENEAKGGVPVWAKVEAGKITAAAIDIKSRRIIPPYSA